jgi:hypothetical protein
LRHYLEKKKIFSCFGEKHEAAAFIWNVGFCLAFWPASDIVSQEGPILEAARKPYLKNLCRKIWSL